MQFLLTKNCTFFIVFVYLVFDISGLLYAQNKVNVDEGKSDSDKIDNAIVTGNDENIDPIVMKSFVEYRDFIFNKVNPMEDNALKAGSEATPDEIRQRAKIIKRALPNMSIPDYMVRSEIIVQKYLERLYRLQIPVIDIENTYKKYFGMLKSTDLPTINELGPHLKLRVLLIKPDIENELRTIQEEKTRSMMATMQKALEAWSDVELKIEAPENECLAMNIDSNKCLITVKQFNQKVRYQNIPKRVALDSARYFAIKKMLTDLFIIKQAEDSGFANSDSTEIMKENYLRLTRDQKKFLGLGSRVTDENSLWRVYSDYFQPLFQKRRFIYISLLGSSDSSFIDSIAQIVMISNNKNNQAADSISMVIPWKHLLKRDLPVELFAVCDTFKNGQIGIVTTKYGYFIIRKDSSVVRPEQRFEDVKGQLIYLATKQKWLNVDSIYQENAFNIYKKNKNFSTTPDTFNLTIRFYPDTVYKKNNSNRQLKPGKIIDHSDQLMGTVKISSSMLPYVMQEKLMEIYNDVHDIKKMSVTVKTNIGVWDINVLSRKPGGLNIPFKCLKNQIVDSLIRAEMDSLFHNPLMIDSTMNQMVLAHVYMPHFLGVDGKLRDKLISEERKQRQQENSASNSGDIKETIEKYKQGQIKKIDEWLSRIEINRTLF